MFEIIFLFSLALIWILFAAVQDLRTTEVANWLSFSLIIFALGFRLFYSIFSSAGLGFFYQGLIGFAIFYVLGNLLYNAKMFAGGDAKLFIALGAVLPTSKDFLSNINGSLSFLLIFFIIGAAYSLITSFYMCIRNYHNFRREFRKQFKINKKIVNLATLAAIFIGLLGLFINSILFYLAILFFILPYFYLYARAVDEVAMVTLIPTQKLTEGDWLYKDVKVKGKTIRATWDGLSKKEILLLRKHKKKVLIRKGIPFTPVFLMSFTVFFYLVASGLRYFFW